MKNFIFDRFFKLEQSTPVFLQRRRDASAKTDGLTGMETAVAWLTQTGSSPHHGVQAGSDAVSPHLAPLLEQEPVVVVVGQLLHSNAHDAPRDRPDRHAGDEQA